MLRKFLIALFVINLIAPATFAQRKATVASNKPAAAPKCSGAWTGTVTYKRTQSRSDGKHVERVSGRGYDTTNWEMKYDYNARVVVTEAPEMNGSSRGRGTVNHSFSSVEKVDAVEKNSCDRGKTWKDMKGSSISESNVSGSATADANVSIGVNNDGTYSVSVGLPSIQGQASGKTSSEYSGQCTTKPGKTFTSPSTATTIDGNSLSSDGKDRINPSDPNRISGSFTNTIQDITDTIE